VFCSAPIAELYIAVKSSTSQSVASTVEYLFNVIQVAGTDITTSKWNSLRMTRNFIELHLQREHKHQNKIQNIAIIKISFL
jgi:hypothetical protein